MTRRGTPGVAAVLLLGAAAACFPGGARAQVLEGEPAEVQGVGIVDRSGTQLPMDLTFRDENGVEVSLGSFFRPGHPVAVNIVYFNCPMLCNVFLDGFTAGMRDLDWVPGNQYDVVTVSMDSRDDTAGAVKKKAHYLQELGRPEAAAGWHFLTGSAEHIRALADSLGFKYRFLEDRGEFAHSAGLFVATPDGHISRTITGVVFEPQTLRLALVEASDGRIGTPVDQFLLFCFAYDHTAGKYGPTALKLVRLFGLMTLVALGILLTVFWRRDARRHRSTNLGASS